MAADGNTLFLIDAMALAYRSHFVFINRPLINKDGNNTSASYGFTNALLKLIDDHDIEHVAVVFDAPSKEGTFRKDLYEDYKAHRKPMPEELAWNLPHIKRIVQALDIPVLEVPGVEADDTIGTLARRAEGDGAEVVIVSPDKDFKQLLSEKVTLFRPARQGESFDPVTLESFCEDTGLDDPDQFRDVLALQGDASDNVPGVPLIGKKTALKLLKEYGRIESVIEHADDVGGKRGESLKEHAEEARLSKKLVTILTDVDVEVEWHTLQRNDPHAERLREVFEELGFQSFLRRLEEGSFMTRGHSDTPPEDPALQFDFGEFEAVGEYDPDAVDYASIETRAELEVLADELKETDTLALDTETTSTDSMAADLVGLSFSWAEGVARYVPTPLPDGTTTEEVLEVLQPVLEAETLKVGQNLKYDFVVLARHGAEVGGPLFDTMVAHYLVQPEENHGLDDIARKYLSYRPIPIERLIGKGRDQITMDAVALDQVTPYACEDADISLRLMAPLREALEEADALEIAEKIEFPLVRVLADMEAAGIKVDKEVLAEIAERMQARLEELEEEIYEIAGEPFNVNSPAQLGEVLFEKLGLRVIAKTSTGKPSTKESVLQELAKEHELPEMVLDYRSVSKLKGTYVDGLPKLIHPQTKRIHTSFNQTVTATGRLSSSNPNLQNIPIRTAQGREIRKAFVPKDSCVLIAADYVQIELRILAAMSHDKDLIAAFAEGRDIHTDVAARIYDAEPDAITRDQRRKAKEVNYGIPYGVSAWGLSQRLNSSVDEAQGLIDQYQRSYPRVMSFLNEQVEQARHQGYVETMLGRRRYLPDIRARNRNTRQFAERVAVNAPIQGTQADMIKIAMVAVHRRLDAEGLETRILLQVHDELVLEGPADELDQVREIVTEEMVAALPLEGVPVEVDFDTGENWLDAH